MKLVTMRKAGGRRRNRILGRKESGRAQHPGPARPRKRPAHLAAGPHLEVLKDRYGETRLVMMAVDPYLVHAFWEVTEADLKTAQASLGRGRGEAKPVLRFHDITNIDFNGTNALYSFDVEIDLRPRNWYVRLWSAEKTYCVDLGFADAGGRFARIARWNTLRVPRAEPSSRLDAHFWRPGEPAVDPLAEQEEPVLPPALRDQTEFPNGQAASPDSLPGVELEVPTCAVEHFGPAAPDDSPLATAFANGALPVPDAPRDATETPDAGQDVPESSAGALDLSLECERQFLPGLSSV